MRNKYIFRYRHYRILQMEAPRAMRSGAPDAVWLNPYSRKNGFGRYHEHSKPYERGGLTVCRVFDNDDKLVHVGVAVCSMSENFCYAEGRRRARDRALCGFRYKEMVLDVIANEAVRASVNAKVIINIPVLTVANDFCRLFVGGDQWLAIPI